jgi:predicted RNA-binding Zn-ribbon protein involved in translation (DUF1610 family)
VKVLSRTSTVTSGPVNVTLIRPRKASQFATRNCVHCGGELLGDDGSVLCPKCGKRSTVSLCEHGGPRPAWRITRWGESPGTGQHRPKDVVAVAVGDVTVFVGRFRDTLSLRAEDGTRLPLRRVHAIEPGCEIIERMTHIGSCYRCNVAFFLADCEVFSPGPPAILRAPLPAPTREYMRPTVDPVKLAASYLALGTRPEEEL